MGDSKTTKDSNKGSKGSQAQPKPVASQGSKSGGSGDKGKKPADQGDDKGKKPVKEDKKSKPDDDKGKKPDDKGKKPANQDKKSSPDDDEGKKPDTKPEAQHSKTLQASQGSDDEGDGVADPIAELSAALQRVRDGGIQVTLATKLYNENMRVFKEYVQANDARKMLGEKRYSSVELKKWDEQKDKFFNISNFAELLLPTGNLGRPSKRSIKLANDLAYSKEVKDFVKQDDPQALFINGNEDVDGKLEAPYATGIIAIRIFHLTVDMKNDLTMAWSCTGNPDRTPRDMVYCLLGQIARNGAIVKLPEKGGLSFVRLLQYVTDAIRTNLLTSKVWCNIEGISEYQDKDSSHKKEMMSVVEELVDMVILSRSAPHPFNFLMLSPIGGECYDAYKKRVEGNPDLEIEGDPDLKFMGPGMAVNPGEGVVKPNKSEPSSEGSSRTVTPGSRGSGTATPVPGGGSRRS
ncbi:hypothetical protein LTR37_011474 [Vermiconidia calcicola]|uniref:Uncharacterized protein n=1 Tax=Vermiconidia calcicola TaxID=1690605 RepID=A0ACC3N238_9PEZI|nr:hypothetical protein LTR37_011474 [Vermiconidia calcicola]